MVDFPPARQSRQISQGSTLRLCRAPGKLGPYLAVRDAVGSSMLTTCCLCASFTLQGSALVTSSSSVAIFSLTAGNHSFDKAGMDDASSDGVLDRSQAGAGHC